ncbi:alpha/beta hydrolase [Aliiglaciecola sp. 2_MG-2023]|uniref:alpha/beta hydrolase n=1 Tax=unclassified Aliiglaciecola TaxID=2593648 RepID=UPI0026E3427A|nr:MULTISPECIES: alpha/beta hydrolase [unclassified Aliiglaciecola]MDO6711690.1 alpha/beta hydrolase [Aliiglaciecola sp. 2_MG-2023]MDO6752761.1 alpha/beta hydrolase [Aliiglaciecola sp. 1_MG-2023]
MLSKDANKQIGQTEKETFFGSQNTAKENVSDKAEPSSTGLDDHAQEVLNYIHSLPPAYEFEPKYVRQFRKNPYEHEDVTDITREDISIPCANHELEARVYRPASSHENLYPTLIYFHGGGFVLGDIHSYDKFLAQLCVQSNVVIISVAYRLAPETVFPGAIEDTQESTDWIVENALSLKLDSTRIGLGGDSAGANLAIVYCLLNKNKFKPYFQLLIYPSIVGNNSTPSREAFSKDLLLTENLLKWFHQHYISKEDENDPRFNVLNAEEFAHLPPAFILTCGFDPLRDEGQMFVDKLTENGVAVKHSCYTDMFHGFINFGVLQQSKDAVTECAMVLNSVMYQS